MLPGSTSADQDARNRRGDFGIHQLQLALSMLPILLTVLVL